ncbi:hypothetical protein [Fibrella forsythiae]|uniref:Uncharacterized protein n=1 Tax=Fibrella forsythiae TaxID=2817061 RepID=A0ABS3JFK0_9BACT|nr:hypothetical protein [Fibrella forsythiae]MBO0948211.1 hypothetical protein [Fibrella forsythiae]
MKIPSIALFLVLSVVAKAQTAPAAEPTGIETSTFGMAKATLEFLATDQKTFGTVKKPACDGCTTYGDLADFIKANNLKKADGLVNDIKKHSMMLNDEFAADAFSSEGAVLDSLRRYVLKRVTNGTERVHRTQLASFAAYQTKMTALAGGADPDKAVSEQAAASQEGETTAESAEQTTASSGMSLGTWAFWLSLLNLLGLGYLLLMRQRGPGTTASDKEDARLAGLQDENTRLSNTVAELANRLTIAEKRLVGSAPAGPANRPVERGPSPTQPIVDRGPADRGMMPQTEPPRRPDAPADRGPMPVQGGNQPRTGYGNPANPVIPTQPSVPAQPAQASGSGTFPGQSQGGGLRTTPVVPPPPSQLGGSGTFPVSSQQPGVVDTGNAGSPAVPPAPAPSAPPTKLFARTADLGNGFSVAGLLEIAERGTVYEIDLTNPVTATFRVSQSPESQQLAMSDPYSYLSDACLYENQPGGPNSRIQTVAPGQLTLQGDKWQITEKARIGFV